MAFRSSLVSENLIFCLANLNFSRLSSLKASVISSVIEVTVDGILEFKTKKDWKQFLMTELNF